MITEENENPSYYTNIPASVRYDKEIPANAKLLYGEIGCLSNKYGYCFAKNDYFAELYDLSEDRISKLIHLLEKKGYVEIELERNDQRFVINRKIKLLDPNMLPSKVKNNESNGKNNYGEKLKITSSDGKNNGSNNNTYNTNTLNTNTNPFPKPDYEEEVDEKPKKNFRYLKNKTNSELDNYFAIITPQDKDIAEEMITLIETNVKSVNPKFHLAPNKRGNEKYELLEFSRKNGIELIDLKNILVLGLKDSWWGSKINNSHFFINNYNRLALNVRKNAPSIQKGKSFFEDKQRDFSNIQDGGNW